MPEAYRIHRHVSESDPEYQGNLEKRRKAYSGSHFSADLIDRHERGERADFEYLFAKLFRKYLESLHDKGSYSISRGRILTQKFSEIFSDPSVRGLLIKIFEDVPSDPAELASKILNKIGQAPQELTELLYAVSKFHSARFEKEKLEFEKFVQQTKESFKLSIAEAVEAGSLPEEALKSLWRLEGVGVFLKDILSDPTWPNVAAYDPALAKIEVGSDLVEIEGWERIRKTLFHEFFHVISGKAINFKEKIGSIEDIESARGKIEGVLDIKHGLQFKTPNGSHYVNSWINEAVTEYLALQFSGFEGEGSYSDERSDLSRLLEKGLDAKLVFRAYFENFVQEDHVSGERWQFGKLVEEVNRIEGQFAFARLEKKYILRHIEEKFIDMGGRALGEVEAEVLDDPDTLKIECSMGIPSQSFLQKTFAFPLRPDREKALVRLKSFYNWVGSVYGQKVKFNEMSAPSNGGNN